MKTPYSRGGADKRVPHNPKPAAHGGTTPFDIRTLDIHTPVQAVRFGLITSYLTDIFMVACRDGDWEQESIRRLASMRSHERSLSITALLGYGHAPKFSRYTWLAWGDVQRSVAVTEMVEQVTRLYVLHWLLATHGRKLDPYQTSVINLIENTRFCTEG